MAVNTDFQKDSFEKNAFKVLKGKKVKKKIVNNFENFSLMHLKLWEYIFEMFNYKIRQKKSIFSKLQTLTPPLNILYLRKKLFFSKKLKVDVKYLKFVFTFTNKI